MSDKKTHGIRATSHEYSRYDQVDKKHDYHLAEGAEDLFDQETEIRICDVGRFQHGNAKDREAFARELGEALEGIGFAILENHGVDPDLHRKTFQDVEDFFTGVSLEEKLRFRARRQGSVNQGYFPIKETSDIHPDLVEGWVFCRRAFDLGENPDYRAGDFWPDPNAEPGFRKLVIATEPLILPIMQSLLTYFGCEPHLYDQKLTRTNIGLRLNYYPPVAKVERQAGGARLLGHEDIDMFTFLPAPKVEGLQVLNQKNGRWIRLSAPEGSIVLNTGDYFQRISNDRFPSTTHRVSPPSDPALCNQPRTSFPMAVYIREDEMLEVLPGLGPPKYQPIRVIEFHTGITSKFYGDDYAVKAKESRKN